VCLEDFYSFGDRSPVYFIRNLPFLSDNDDILRGEAGYQIGQDS